MNDVSRPPRLRNSTGIVVTANRTHHETSDNYDDIIVDLTPRWRVIACRDRIQWIVQKRSSKHLNKGKWLGKWYCTTRKALIATCSSLGLLTEAAATAVLEALPEFISEYHQK